MSVDVKQLVGVAELQSFTSLRTPTETVEVLREGFWGRGKAPAPPPPLPPPQPQKIAVTASVQCAFQIQ